MFSSAHSSFRQPEKEDFRDPIRFPIQASGPTVPHRHLLADVPRGGVRLPGIGEPEVDRNFGIVQRLLPPERDRAPGSADPQPAPASGEGGGQERLLLRLQPAWKLPQQLTLT